MATKRKVTMAPQPRTVGALLRAAGACRSGSRPFNGFPNTAAGRRAALEHADESQVIGFTIFALGAFMGTDGVPALNGGDPERAREWLLCHQPTCYVALMGRAAWCSLSYRSRWGT